MYPRRPPSSRTVHKLRQPVGIRRECIADAETLFYLRPRFNSDSNNDYTLKKDEDGSVVYTVTGEKYGDSSSREFRDASGLPIFECHRTWRGRRACLPGNKVVELADLKLKWSEGWRLEFRNTVAVDSKDEKDKMVKVDVQMTKTIAWHEFSVTMDEQKVVDIRENMVMNKTTPTLYNSRLPTIPPRPVLDVRVAEGFDTSLAAMIAVAMSDINFRSSPGR